MEDFSEKRVMMWLMDGLKLLFNLLDYFMFLKFVKENVYEIEFKVKEEREGKMRGVLRVMKR